MGPSTWSVVGASVVGSSHLAAGTPCQDRHAWLLHDDGTLVLAVADGAGSAARSDEGAAAAVGAAVADPGDPLGAARAAVEALDGPLADLACTLLVVVAGGDHAEVLAIGDGAVVVRAGDGALQVPLPPDRGEYRNETTFLTGDGWREAVRQAELPPAATALAVLTDGLELLALDLASGEPHAPFFDPLLAFAGAATDAGAAEEELRAFLASPRVDERSDDDRTLLLAVLREATC